MPLSRGNEGEKFMQILTRNYLRYVNRVNSAVTPDIESGSGGIVIATRLENMLGPECVDCLAGSIPWVSNPERMSQRMPLLLGG